MFKTAVVVVCGTFILSSCASKVHRGVVAMKMDESTAHVGIRDSEVNVGDHVELYGNKCARNRASEEQSCVRVSKGHGTITQILNADYSTVKFDSGVAFQEGDTIEKHSH